MWYRIFRALTIITIGSLYRVKVEGLENLPQRINFIVASNHNSFLDPLLVGMIIPPTVHFVARRELHQVSWLSLYLKLTRTVATGRSLETLADLLEKNKCVGIFPEGGCSLDGKLRRFKSGAAYLGLKTGRPIVPCAIIGTYEAFPVTARFPRFFMPIKVKIGKPIYLLKEFEDEIDSIKKEEGTIKIRKSIKDMLASG